MCKRSLTKPTRDSGLLVEECEPALRDEVEPGGRRRVHLDHLPGEVGGVSLRGGVGVLPDDGRPDARRGLHVQGHVVAAAAQGGRGRVQQGGQGGGQLLAGEQHHRRAT